MKPILEIQNISKSFRINHELLPYLTIREQFMDMVKGIRTKSTEEFWALKNVSFEINKGDSVAIIGKNGAGKSTLLKILSKITPPTEGKIISRGRIASLLEVGTGFHPELTGRENIFLNGSILGMRKNEIQKKFDDIVDFSGVVKFLDTPLKHYSSGMQLRLAFAVAAFLEPEILIIDEVLAVGDSEFQKRCMGKMSDVSKSGRTVLFVSHNMAAVRQLCSHAIMLDSGKVAMNNEVEKVVDFYLQQQSHLSNFYSFNDNTAPKGENIILRKVNIHSEGKQPFEAIYMNENIEIEFEYENLTDQFLDITIDLIDDMSNHVFHVGTVCNKGDSLSPGTYHTTGTIPANLLNSRMYFLNVVFGKNQRQVLLKKEYLASFSVEKILNPHSANFAMFPGIIHPTLTWKTKSNQS